MRGDTNTQMVWFHSNIEFLMYPVKLMDVNTTFYRKKRKPKNVHLFVANQE